MEYLNFLDVGALTC